MGVSLVILILSAAIGYFLVREDEIETEKTEFALIEPILGISAISGIWYFLFHHAAVAWTASIWQLLSGRVVAACFGVFIFFGLLLLNKKISSLIIFLFTTTFVGFNYFLFPSGFGFDSFVHDATIQEILQNGFVTPTTFLYNGFHSIILLITILFHIKPLTVISLITPIIMGAAITAVYARTCTKKNNHIAALLLLIFFGILPTLWTTATPQALGHILFFILVIEWWLAEHAGMITKKMMCAYLLICCGITLIHPLSGIPAFCFFAWQVSRIKKYSSIALFAVTALAPAALLVIGARGVFQLPKLSSELFTQLAALPPESFQPFVLMRLAFVWHVGAPLILLICALYGWWIQKKASHKTDIIFSSALFCAAILATFVRIDSIIGYEQYEFARRLLLAAEITLIPNALAGIIFILDSTKKITRIIIVGLLLTIAFTGWYTAYAPWNTVTRTKAINVSKTDFEIVQSIDAHAQGAPYIVLADQVTSAAALHEFGFSARRVPNHEYYFYPIPTGEKLYTQYFLPAVYSGVTRELLTRAAKESGVTHIFVVFKPYWEPSDERIAELKLNTTDWWTIGGAYIGHLEITR